MDFILREVVAACWLSVVCVQIVICADSRKRFLENGFWSPWSQCSHTCGGGIRSRYFVCTTADSSILALCSSNQLAQCNSFPCPATVYVDGLWGPWTQYGSCSHSCGTGIMMRFRYCNNPAPPSGGMYCSGSDKQYAACNAIPCSVDGSWSDWSHWSPCSASCGLGSLSRDRTCSNPPPTGSGLPCLGNSSVTKECSAGPCAVWSHWFEGTCSHSCGNGTMERLRHCSTGNDLDCAGKAYEIVQCSNIDCI